MTPGGTLALLRSTCFPSLDVDVSSTVDEKKLRCRGFVLGAMTKPKKSKVVEIDDRLTNLFTTRKNEGVAANSEQSEPTEPAPMDVSWLKEFQTQTSMVNSNNLDEADYSENTMVSVDLSEVRPFWALEDRKSMISLWKQSKLWLAKDCQKQRKAALRKTSSK